ncbi:hypothetical protein NQD34_009764, partial [Periophthalmus magnuspinnatus]
SPSTVQLWAVRRARARAGRLDSRGEGTRPSSDRTSPGTADLSLRSVCLSCPRCYRESIKMFLAKRLLGGIVTVISNIDPADFKSSDPPPPRRPLNFAESHESEEEKKFRQTFQQLAGDDMEISPEELKKILDNICRKRGLEIGTDGFSIETCRSMVAVMDSDSTGKLGFHEFKFLWGNIKKWQVSLYIVYQGVRGVEESEGTEEPCSPLCVGFRLNDPAKKTNDLYSLLVRRYADQDGQMDFDNYVGCLVRLDSMCRAFKTLDKDNNGTINLGIEEWLQLTMYS